MPRYLSLVNNDSSAMCSAESCWSLRVTLSIHFSILSAMS